MAPEQMFSSSKYRLAVHIVDKTILSCSGRLYKTQAAGMSFSTRRKKTVVYCDRFVSSAENLISTVWGH